MISSHKVIEGNYPLVFKRPAYLINIIKLFGWTCLTDKNEIIPDTFSVCEYINNNKKSMSEVFENAFINVDVDNVVDLINPFFVKIWKIQIVGSNLNAKLEMLV